MTALHENDELHRLVDRLTPDQARRLLALAKADSALAAVADADTAVAGAEEELARRVMRPFGPMAEPGLAGDALARFRSFAGASTRQAAMTCPRTTRKSSAAG